MSQPPPSESNKFHFLRKIKRAFEPTFLNPQSATISQSNSMGILHIDESDIFNVRVEANSEPVLNLIARQQIKEVISEESSSSAATSDEAPVRRSSKLDHELLSLSLESDNSSDLVRRVSRSDSPPIVTWRKSDLHISTTEAQRKLQEALQHARVMGAGFKLTNDGAKQHKYKTEKIEKIIEAARDVLDCLLFFNEEPLNFLRQMLNDFKSSDYGMFGMLHIATAHIKQSESYVKSTSDVRSLYKYPYIVAAILKRTPERTLRNIVTKPDLLSLLLAFFHGSEPLDPTESAAICIIIVDLIGKSRFIEQKVVHGSANDKEFLTGLFAHIGYLPVLELAEMLTIKSLEFLPVLAENNLFASLTELVMDALSTMRIKSQPDRLPRLMSVINNSLEFLQKTALHVLNLKFGVLSHENPQLHGNIIEKVNRAIHAIHPMVYPNIVFDIVSPILSLECSVDSVPIYVQSLKAHASRVANDIFCQASITRSELKKIQLSNDTRRGEISLPMALKKNPRPALGPISWDVEAYEKIWLDRNLLYLRDFEALKLSEPLHTLNYCMMESIFSLLEYSSKSSWDRLVDAGAMTMLMTALKSRPESLTRQQFITQRFIWIINATEPSTRSRKKRILFGPENLLETVVELFEYKSEATGEYLFRCEVSSFAQELYLWLEEFENQKEIIDPDVASSFRNFYKGKIEPYLHIRKGLLGTGRHPKEYAKPLGKPLGKSRAGPRGGSRANKTSLIHAALMGF